MYDILRSDGKIKIKDNIVEIVNGIHLFPSKLENAALDDVILNKGLGIDRVYNNIINTIKSYYDLIIIDCPPALGRSVVAAANTADKIISPIIPDKLCLIGLDLLRNMLYEIENSQKGKQIPYEILYNKFNSRTFLSKYILSYLLTHKIYKNKLNENYIRQSQEFSNKSLNNLSIYDDTKKTLVKNDIDSLTTSLLEINNNDC